MGCAISISTLTTAIDSEKHRDVYQTAYLVQHETEYYERMLHTSNTNGNRKQEHRT